MVLLVLLVSLIAPVLTQTQPSCDSKIFCQGDLLHTVQMARPFNDSKSFVDMRLLNDEEATLANFEALLNETNNIPTRSDIQRFVQENFAEANEFEDWVPSDYTEKPAILAKIIDDEVKYFASELVKIWPNLSRKVKQEVLDQPEYFTLLPVKNGFVIPGGRFKEFYYWDSYWIIKGLLLSDMHETVKGMLDNFLSIVEQYGFLPNGARIYYLNRSQPPLLCLMAATYVEATKDVTWLKNNIHTLDRELRFWLNNKLTTVVKDDVQYSLAHYNSESGSPRPESYYEDVMTANAVPEEKERVQLWAEIKSGAESGLDFSSRWFLDENGTTNANLSSIQTRRIIPVDLNAFLCQAFRKLGELYAKLDDYSNALFWLETSNLFQNTIQSVLYNSDDGIWYDYDSVLRQHRKYFFPSNFAPLWADAYDPLDADALGQRAAEYFVKNKIDDYLGGIPASLADSGEQWDLPNAWPPQQSLVILGLDRSGNCQAKKIAKEFADRWIHANIIGYNQTGEMFEKYDAQHPGQYGGGGEYTVQSGFGWTNGVIFEFIERFYVKERRRWG